MRWKRILGLVVLIAGLCAALGFFWHFGRETKPLRQPGVVEIQEVRLGSKVGGRVEDVFVNEGDRVKAGDRMVTFEVPELRAHHAQTQALLYQAEAELKKAHDGPRPEEIEAAGSAYEAAQAKHKRLQVGFRTEEKDQAQSEFDSADADLKLARQDFNRVFKAFAQRAVSSAELEISRATLERSRGRARAARARLNMMNVGSRQEDIDEAAAEMRRTKANYDLLMAGTRKEDILVAEHRAAEIRAKLLELEANLSEATVVAKEPAIVEVLAVRRGDLVPPNQPVLRVVRDVDIWVKVYVPETDLDRVRLGQEVTVTIDSGQRFTGKVIKTLLGLFLPFILAMLGLGLWVSTRASTRDAAMQLSMGTVIPSIFLSGYVFPLDSMPRFFYYMSQAIPTTWKIDAARGVILRGAGWQELWPHAAVLWVMAGGVLIFSTLRFLKRLS
jgi:multidrug resistance efflux pump